MPLSIPTTVIKSSLLSKFFLIFIFILLSHGGFTKAQSNNKIMNIGAIIDANSRIGREEKIAMEIAIQEFNNHGLSNNYKLVLHVSDSGGDPLKAASEANNLIEDKKVQAIIGLETWQEVALVAEVANRAQVPVISFTTPAITPPLTSLRWPFLARMAHNASLQMKCVANIVGSYRWREVIVIYEDDTYGGDSGIITLLSKALHDVGSEIEYWLALPYFSSHSDPKKVIREELKKLKSKQSRVFIVHSSIQLASHIFTEAKEMDLMGKDSVWITTDSITNVFDTLNSSVMSSMEGVIGIKSHFLETNPSFQGFSIKFRKKFLSEYLDEYKYDPGISALRAYDTISSVARAIERLTNISTPKTLLQNILSSNFSGLSGEIRFGDGELSQNQVYSIVNVIKKGYMELKLWSIELGFWGEKAGDMEALGRVVNWPGGLLERPPQRSLMPGDSKKLVIGVPGRTSFETFVKVKEGEEPTGFCIDVFKEALKHLHYDLPHEFQAFNGTYDQLVDQVYYKNFDAVVGDVTILANRSNYVEFTQPYAESGLSMIVPVKSEESQKAWLFLKPFTMAMWLVTGAVFVYTMFIVWFLEHRSNPEFRGPWKSQLGTALWFTFSTLFFAHRERLRNNFTRMVVVVWLFVVFVVTSSYTASLTSMLTIQRLEPAVTDISNIKIGCDGDSFVRTYLEQVLEYNVNSITNIKSEYDYPGEFKNGSIKVAFLELPYLKVFLSKYKGYIVAGPTHRFGGLGFVFPKGSHIAKDISKAILELSEDGTITKLEDYWFKPQPECSKSDNQSLSLHNFWGLFVLTVGTSTIVFLLYLIRLFKNFRRHREAYRSNTSPEDDSLWNRTKRVAHYFDKGIVSTSAQPVDVEDWIPTSGEHVSGYNTPGHPQTSSPAEIEMADAYVAHLDTHARALSLAEIEMADTYVAHLDTHARVLSLASFPGWDRRLNGKPLANPEQQLHHTSRV